MSWEQVVSVIALILALGAVIVGTMVLRRLSQARARPPALVSSPGATESGPEPAGPPAVVINPSKVTRPAALRTLITDMCAELQLPEPIWLETTKDDPGHGQTQQALAAGASVVIAAGGDGTVRTVASALAGTGVPMGLLPVGTANLLARNLDLPVEGSRARLLTALTGTEHPIDLGWIRLTHREGPDGGMVAEEGEHSFLVMAGIGFDAAMVAGADEQLKARMGWMAYFVAGAQHLHGRKIRLSMQVGDTDRIPLRLRSLLFANCGRLPGGIVLLPDAELNDGWLDVAAIDTRGGLLGWASLFGKVVLQGIGVRRDLPGQPGSIEFWRGRTVSVRTERPEQIQVDGDLVGRAHGVEVRIDPGALIVRTR